MTAGARGVFIRGRDVLPRAVSSLARRCPLPRERYAILFFSLVIIYTMTASYRHQNKDAVSVFFAAWQLAQHGNVTMEAFAGRTDLWFVQAQDRLVPNRFPGTIWYATPFYLLDRGSTPSVVFANFAAAVATAAAVVVLLALLRRLVSTRTAVAAVLLVALGTPVWTISGHSLWTHGPGQLWLLAGLALYASQAHLLAGVAWGAAILTRPHLAAVPAVFGMLDFLSLKRWRPCVAVAAGSAVGLAMLLLYNLNVFGAPVARGYEYGAITPDADGALVYLERLAGTLVSPSRGVFLLTPFLVVLLPGIPAAWARAPLWVRSSAIAGTVYMLTQLALNRWWGGEGFFSYRLPIEWLTLCTPLLVLAYQAWVVERRARRLAFLLLAAYSVGTHVAGAVLFDPRTRDFDPWTAWEIGPVFVQQPVAAAVIAGLGVVATAAAAVALGAPRTSRRGAVTEGAETA